MRIFSKGVAHANNAQRNIRQNFLASTQMKRLNSCDCLVSNHLSLTQEVPVLGVASTLNAVEKYHQDMHQFNKARTDVGRAHRYEWLNLYERTKTLLSH
jgi:hypothetical protein